MALYAYDEEILVYAANAEDRRSYRCSHCKSLVKVRKGPYKIPHFYHVSRSPTCRLYSKSQDHLLAQLAIQKLLPQGETTLEKPFLEILRVADVIWEPHKIAFEIQCSLLSQLEAERRVQDYATAGYQVVWILDDRIYNRQILRPAEHWMREHLSYYATLRKHITPLFYDQFEVFQTRKRIKKGFRVNVCLQTPCTLPPISWPEDRIPKQIVQRASSTQIYFQGDLVHKAILSLTVPSLAVSMHNLHMQECILIAQEKKTTFLRDWITWAILNPFGLLMLYLLEKAKP